MQSATEANVVMVKLSDGEDVFASLEQVCRERGIASGTVQWGIGMLRDFEIGYFGPDGYEKEAYADPHELVAMHGSIAMGSEPKFHLHVALAGRDHRVVGGHLFRATACVVNEIRLERFGTIRVSRRANPRTGLNELQVE